MFKKAQFYCICLLVGLTSCVKDVDFNQAENIVLTPTIVSSIVFAEVVTPRFVDNGVEVQIVRDSIANIEIFESDFLDDNLVKAELTFEVTNTINRAFNLEMQFLNEADALQHSFNFDVTASPSGTATTTNYTELFEDASLEALKMSSKIVLTFTLTPSTDGSIFNESSPGKATLKSAGTFFFNINL